MIGFNKKTEVLFIPAARGRFHGIRPYEINRTNKQNIYSKNVDSKILIQGG